MRKKIIIFLLLGSLLGVIWFIVRETNRIQSIAMNVWTEDQAADCAVVLTGGPNRLNEGLDLLAQGRVKKLIVAGVNPGSRFEEIFPKAYYYGSISKEDIILERRSQTTFGNAEQSLSIVEALNCRDILLVTSYVHMYRSLRTFKASYPREIHITPRATIGGNYPETRINILSESIKSLFYSIWAYEERR